MITRTWKYILLAVGVLLLECLVFGCLRRADHARALYHPRLKLISSATALKTALFRVPGTLMDHPRMLGTEDSPVWSFDVLHTVSNCFVVVNVDALTGKILKPDTAPTATYVEDPSSSPCPWAGLPPRSNDPPPPSTRHVASGTQGSTRPPALAVGTGGE